MVQNTGVPSVASVANVTVPLSAVAMSRLTGPANVAVVKVAGSSTNRVADPDRIRTTGLERVSGARNDTSARPPLVTDEKRVGSDANELLRFSSNHSTGVPSSTTLPWRSRMSAVTVITRWPSVTILPCGADGVIVAGAPATIGNTAVPIFRPANHPSTLYVSPGTVEVGTGSTAAPSAMSTEEVKAGTPLRNTRN